MIKEKYENLLKAVDEEDQEFIYDCMNTYRKYVNAVVRMEIRIPLIRLRMEPEDLQYEIMQMDATRRRCHDAAIDACNMLNRLSERLGLPVFFEGDTKERYQVADFCLKVCQELFLNGQKTSISELVAEGNSVPALKKEA